MSGKVQAVRGINFELPEGETLAIVGESGSGKSVTSKAILGILAGNSIVEGGEILYDRMDLLKIPEDEFYKIRGDKIAMIFQDPLSSLNPIMRIGRQLTEAMLLKGKARQKASRSEFNSLLETLNSTMIEALAGGDKKAGEEYTKMCKDFDSFEFKHIELEKDYNAAINSAKTIIPEIENIQFLMEKEAFEDQQYRLKEVCEAALASIHTYVVSGEDETTLRDAVKAIKDVKRSARLKKDFSGAAEPLETIKEVLNRAVALEEPNFFSQGYYLTFSGSKSVPENMSVSELNEYLHQYLDDNFMLNFIDKAQASLDYSARKHDALKQKAIDRFAEVLPAIMDEATGEKELSALCEELSALVKEAIDPIDINRDSVAYTFGTSLKDAVKTYANGKKRNAEEEKRFAKEEAKYEAAIARQGTEPDWKPAPKALVDLDLVKENIIRIISRVKERFEAQVAEYPNRDFHEETVAVIDYLKLNASGVVNNVTKKMAKARALKLMEEVGIADVRKRYRQYPFEFSGGMRQRIVIAIALAADPDILICDEPTTALDVTIQAQILELINRIKKERNLSIIFITHDLGVVANMADKIAVMYAGKIVEYGSCEDIFYEPAHPYTWALLSSMPDLDTKEKLEAIPGTPPNMIYPPKGDAFAERNKYALEIDFEEQPPMFRISDSHYAATWLLHPDAPHIDPPKIVTERVARMKQRAAADAKKEESGNE